MGGVQTFSLNFPTPPLPSSTAINNQPLPLSNDLYSFQCSRYPGATTHDNLCPVR